MNIMLRFVDNVPDRDRDFLRHMLSQYESKVPVTPDERKALHRWVSQGNSPYSCGGELFYKDGVECDYITMYRFLYRTELVFCKPDPSILVPDPVQFPPE